MIALFGAVINHVATICATFVIADITAIGIALERGSALVMAVAATLPLAIPVTFWFFGKLFGTLLATGNNLENEIPSGSARGVMGALAASYLRPDTLASYTYPIDSTGEALTVLPQSGFTMRPPKLLYVGVPIFIVGGQLLAAFTMIA